jgi:hypothetical protein
MRQDREAGVPQRTREAPDGAPTPADTDVLAGPAQAPAAGAGALVEARHAAGQEKGQPPGEARLAMAPPVRVGRVLVAIAGDGTVVPRVCGGLGPGVTPNSAGRVS